MSANGLYLVEIEVTTLGLTLWAYRSGHVSKSELQNGQVSRTSYDERELLGQVLVPFTPLRPLPYCDFYELESIQDLNSIFANDYLPRRESVVGKYSWGERRDLAERLTSFLRKLEKAFETGSEPPPLVMDLRSIAPRVGTRGPRPAQRRSRPIQRPAGKRQI